MSLWFREMLSVTQQREVKPFKAFTAERQRPCVHWLTRVSFHVGSKRKRDLVKALRLVCFIGLEFLLFTFLFWWKVSLIRPWALENSFLLIMRKFLVNKCLDITWLSAIHREILVIPRFHFFEDTFEGYNNTLKGLSGRPSRTDWSGLSLLSYEVCSG